MSTGALRKSTSPLRSLAASHPGVIIAASVLGAIALAVAFAPLIAPQDPFDLKSFDVLDAGMPPSWLEGSDKRFLLGTDAQGRDLWSAILYGTRISLMVGIFAVAIQAAIGVPLGLLAGYAGGRVDAVVTRAADVQLSLSTLMMAIIALALFRAALGGESLGRFAVPLLVVVIGIAEWPHFARTARAATQGPPEPRSRAGRRQSRSTNRSFATKPSALFAGRKRSASTWTCTSPAPATSARSTSIRAAWTWP